MASPPKPNFIATTVKPLDHADQGYNASIVRMLPARLDRTRKDRSRFFRRESILIKNPDNGAYTIRFAMGAGQKGGVSKADIAVDYDAIDELGVRFNTDVALEVSRASYFRLLWWYARHPDLNVRIPMHLGMTGAILGFVSLIIAFIP